MTGPNPEQRLLQDEDRRRRPRFRCAGLARIICLPSDGMVLTGKLRDLSLHGCGVESISPLECGVRTEILVRVSAASFRAIGQVKAACAPGGIGLEFLQLSARGQGMLEELLRELARQNAIASALRVARQEPEQWNEARATLLRERFPILGRIAASQVDEASSTVDRCALNLDGEEKEMPLDLFL